MPASMPQRSSYSPAGMRKIHHEFDRRRKLTAAAKGGVGKKSSAPPPPRRSVPIQPAPAGATIKNSSAPLPLPRSATIARSPRRERILAPLKTTPPPRTSAVISPGQGGPAIKKSSASPAPRSASISRSPWRELHPLALPAPARLPCSAASDSAKKGTTVLVRTRVGRLPTGQCLVLWLSAVVVSAAEDGYLRVVYNNGKFPYDKPYRIMRVAAEQVKSVPSAVSAPAPAAAASPRPPRPL